MRAIINNRGSVLTYEGSLTDFHGLPVFSLDDCECEHCIDLDPLEDPRRAKVRLLADGGTFINLTHCRHHSLTKRNPS